MRASAFFFSIGLAAVLVSGLPNPAQAAFVRAPWVQDAGKNTVTIAWEAAAAGGTQNLVWGAGAAMDQTTAGTLKSGKLYTATLNGLPASSNFSYKVISGADTSPNATFITAPTTATEPFRFDVYGDNRTNTTPHTNVVNAMIVTAPDFALNTGDLADIPLTQNYNAFFAIEKTFLASTVMFPVPGNHDTISNYQYGFNRPNWYAFQWGNVYFVAISTDDSYGAGSAQYTFVEQALQTAKADPTVKWIVAYHHFPVYSSSNHGSTPGQAMVDLNNLYKANGVDIVFNGHDHDYERSELDGIEYIVAGGGGAPSYSAGTSCPGHVISESVYSFVKVDVDGAENLVITALRTDGTVIDTKTLSKASTGGTPTPTPTPAPSGTPGADPGMSTTHGSGCDLGSLAGTATSFGPGLLGLAAIVALLRRRR